MLELEDQKTFDFYLDYIESFPEFAKFRREDLTAYQDVFGAECEGCVLLLIDESNGEVHYVYGGEEGSYHYQLLSEVGAYFVPAFQQKLEDLGYTTDCKELEHYPWLVEYIPNYKPQE
jgi:hypothetical protein